MNYEIIPDVSFDVKYNLSGTILTAPLLLLELTFHIFLFFSFQKAVLIFICCLISCEKKMSLDLHVTLNVRELAPKGLS